MRINQTAKNKGDKSAREIINNTSYNSLTRFDSHGISQEPLKLI